VAFLAVLAPLLYVVWFLPVWLGIADDAEEGWGIALFGFASTPAIFAAHFIADAFMRRNLAREKTSSRPGFTPPDASCASVRVRVACVLG
jgi:hypothetical protein